MVSEMAKFQLGLVILLTSFVIFGIVSCVKRHIKLEDEFYDGKEECVDARWLPCVAIYGVKNDL